MWEQIVFSNIRGSYPDAEIFYYRTSNGSDIDFVVRRGTAIFAVECKASRSPSLSKGNLLAIADIAPKHSFIAIPADSGWKMKPGIDVVSIAELIQRLR
jgi:predicted AAA+ superfamily ATPase